MTALPQSEPLLTTVSRSGRVESWHRGAVAVCVDGELWYGLGDVDRPVYCRSAVKPLQALPLLERGFAEQAQLSQGEIAVMCASHDGTDMHVALVRRLLARGDLDESLLGCGPHVPFDRDAAQALIAAGQRPLRVHNNCSGKHAGFLHLAKACGDDLAHYLDPACKSQQEVNAAVAAMAGVAAPIEVGVDGCGAPTFLLPLAALARAFSRLANPDGLPVVRATACRHVVAAARSEPAMLAGKARFCAALLRHVPRIAFAKNGAEGVYALAVAPDPARRRCPGGLGIAVKISCGSERGYQPPVVDLLAALGCLPAGVPEALAAWHMQPLLNTNKQRIGEVRCAATWSDLPCNG
jgi:L-asparaginase II